MSAILRGNTRMAIASLKGARWRSGFTILGVVVAVVPVLMILAIGEGVKRQVVSQVEKLGPDVVTVRAGDVTDESRPLEQLSILNNSTNTAMLSGEDWRTVKNSPNVAKAAPIGAVNGLVKVNEDTISNAKVVATTEDLQDLMQIKVQHGEFLDDDLYGQNSAVIGRVAAEDIFKEGVPLGRSFEFRGETYIVRGVLQRASSAPFSTQAELNNSILISYNNAKEVIGKEPPVFQIIASAKDTATPKEVVAGVTKDLQQRHGGVKDFSVLTQAESVRVVMGIFKLVTAFIFGVAVITLLVSGISIMNIMLVSVAERMHEIGIRKAIGATKRQILDQFMIEALLLSLAGGLIGIIIAFCASYVLRIVTSLAPVITWEAAILVLLITGVMGAIFGGIPAIKAARKDPIDALRANR